MKAAILVESLTGNTWKAGELIGANLQQEGWRITGLSRVRQPDFASIQNADIVLVGTWVHGAFILGQAPWALGAIGHLPAMRGKKAAAFATFGLNPGKTIDKMSGAIRSLGADVIGGLALNRCKLQAHSEEFAARLVANVVSV